MAFLYKTRNLGTIGAQSIKPVGGTLYAVEVINTSAATAFIQFFDASLANITLGTTTPDLELQVANGASISFQLPVGVVFNNAITVASTTGEGGGTGSAAGVQFFAQYL